MKNHFSENEGLADRPINYLLSNYNNIHNIKT